MKTLLVTLILVSGVAFGNKPVEKQKNEDPKGNETQLGTKQKTTLDEKSIAWTATNNFMGESQNQMSVAKTEEFKSKKDENLPNINNNLAQKFLNLNELAKNPNFKANAKFKTLVDLPCPYYRPCQ